MLRGPRLAGWLLTLLALLVAPRGGPPDGAVHGPRWGGAPLAAEEPPRQRLTQECTVLPTGDIRIVHTLRLPLRSYNALKDEVRNTALLLRRLGVQGQQATLFRDASASYDDAQSAVRVEARMVGGARNQGAVWHVPVVNAREQEVLEQGPDRIRLLTIVRLSDGADQVVTTSLVFPPGTKNVRLDAAAGRVEAEMPPPPSAPRGRASLHLDLAVRAELMSCFHKLYGMPELSALWVARAVLANEGDGAARDLAVRFRIPGFAEWSPWQRSGWVYPGQTVVEAYFPLFTRAVLDLTAETPAQLELEWTAQAPDGAPLGGQETRALKILGLNDVIWSSMPSAETTSWVELFDQSPLVAATFVSHTDPVVQRFAGMAAALAGGVAATRDDASARRFMHAVYELMCVNRIAYHSPPGLLRDNPRQHVKYARDVLRNRAGTCIDLAILFASTCQAGGLSPLLVFIPGHAFPAVRLPSGELQPLEATAISVAPTGRSLPFDEALQRGEQNLDRALERGAYMLVDIKALRARGVPPPELPALPGDPLADWGIEAKAKPPTPEPAPGAGGRVVPPDAAGTPWRHPDGTFTVVLPAGWRAQADGDGADLASHDPRNVLAEVRLVPREERGTARSLAEELLLGAVLSEVGTKAGLTVLSHTEGTTTDKRHPRSSVHTSSTRDERACYEDFHVLLGREHGLMLRVRWPQEASQAWLPALRALVASLVLHEEPAAAPAPQVHRDANGAFLLEVPSGWTAGPDAQGDLRVARAEGGVTVLVRCLERKPEVRTADQLAADLATLYARPVTSKGGTVEVVNRTRGLAGGAKIAVSSILLRAQGSNGAQDQHEVHAFVGTRTMTLMAMDAPQRLWPLWIPSLRQVFASFRLDDQPLAGADALVPDARYDPKVEPKPKPDAKPEAKPKPDAKPEPKPGAKPEPKPEPKPPTPQPEPKPEPKPAPEPPLDLYEDPAGLFQLHVPKGWRIEGQPLGVSASTLRGDAIVSFTLVPRGGEDHAAFAARALEKLASSFAGWKEQGRALGGGDDALVTRVDVHAVVEGTPVHMRVDLSTFPGFHQMLLLVGPLAQRAAYEPLWEAVLAHYGSVTAGWTPDRPRLRLRRVATERLPYLLEAPSTWRVEPQGLDLVARSLQGDALVVARASPRSHESIDALGADILGRMQARDRSVQVLSQEVREEQGRTLLVARVRDEVGGEAWEREVRALQTPTHDLQLVLATRADVHFKWRALLAAIASSWRPR